MNTVIEAGNFLQSSWRYASPLADPVAIRSLVGQSMIGRSVPATNKYHGSQS